MQSTREIVLAKSRIITAPEFRTVTLLPLNIERHFGPIKISVRDHISFKDKEPVAFWRGVTTGESDCWLKGTKRQNVPGCPRWNLITRWANSSSPVVDVGLSSIVQDSEDKYIEKNYSPYLKTALGIQEMLKFRYLISVEGNDCASNLKWAMASRSVVMMPHPLRETFFGEGLLKPYIHYIPIRSDTEDLESKIRFCEANLDFCESVAKNARQYTLQFHKNSKSILKMAVPILQKHLDEVQKLIHQEKYENTTK
jgi:hypothetical protein